MKVSLKPVVLGVSCLLAASTLLGMASESSAKSPDKLRILDLLQKKKYQVLEAVLTEEQKRYEKGGTSDEMVRRAFYSFANSDPSLRGPLDEWVAKMPQSYAALVARGFYHAHVGWLSRGYRYAQQTNDTQIRGMVDHFALAVRDLRNALSLNPKLTVAYERLMNVSMAMGTRAETAALLREALARDPASWVVRRMYMFSLQPKWGGSIKDMTAFVEASRPYFDRNPRLRLLERYIPYTIADMTKRKNRTAAIPYFDLAVAEGDYWYHLMKRGTNYHYLKKYDKAIADFSRALELYPHSVSVLEERGWSYYMMDKNEEALKDFNLALKLDALEPSILRGRGNVLYEMKKVPQAMQDLRKALIYRSHKAGVWWSIGRIQLYEEKNYVQAAQSLKTAVSLNPKGSKYWYHYSVALHYLQDCEIVRALKGYLKACSAGKPCKAKRTTWANNVLGQLEKPRECTGTQKD